MGFLTEFFGKKGGSLDRPPTTSTTALPEPLPIPPVLVAIRAAEGGEPAHIAKGHRRNASSIGKESQLSKGSSPALGPPSHVTPTSGTAAGPSGGQGLPSPVSPTSRPPPFPVPPPASSEATTTTQAVNTRDSVNTTSQATSTSGPGAAFIAAGLEGLNLADIPIANTKDPLQLAIYYHESNQLDISAYYFSVAASQGSPLGLILYAISLRHGWGCPPNEALAVRLLQKAAESAVSDFNQGRRLKHSPSARLDVTALSAERNSTTQVLSLTERSMAAINSNSASTLSTSAGQLPGSRGSRTPRSSTTGSMSASASALPPLSATTAAPPPNMGPLPTSTVKRIAKTELTLAIFELGMSFKQGWGVPKSKVTAAYYLSIAAQLGDADAQAELGECYLRGDGVQRDKKMAAKWFREASKQGKQMVSMHWIWKDKYNM